MATFRRTGLAGVNQFVASAHPYQDNFPVVQKKGTGLINYLYQENLWK